MLRHETSWRGSEPIESWLQKRILDRCGLGLALTVAAKYSKHSHHDQKRCKITRNVPVRKVMPVAPYYQISQRNICKKLGTQEMLAMLKMNVVILEWVNEGERVEYWKAKSQREQFAEACFLKDQNESCKIEDQMRPHRWQWIGYGFLFPPLNLLSLPSLTSEYPTQFWLMYIRARLYRNFQTSSR